MTFNSFICSTFIIFSANIVASESKKLDISLIISQEEFSTYKNVADFIDHSPKVTVLVAPAPEDISKYGKEVVKTLTGSDCNRDGKMDDNATCNAVYFKLWLKYKR